MKTTEEQTFPMRVVTRMTGLSADVVRVWERRYGAITPARTDGNARRYSSQDIARLTRLRDAIAAGHTIGEIANLADARLRALAAPPEPVTQTRALFEPYLDAIARLDLARGESILTRASQALGARAMVLELLLPLLREVGDRWEAGTLSVGEEHAVSAQVRGHLATLLRTTAVPAGAPRVLFATPPGHRHEMGALMGAVLAATHGASAIYLGADVPFDEIEAACERSRTHVVVLSVLLGIGGSLEARREVRAIEKLARKVEVWVGAPQGHPALRATGVRAMTDYLAFEAELTHQRGIG